MVVVVSGRYALFGATNQIFMKILQINKFYYRRGGADQHFLDLAELLKNNGHEVSVFSMKDKRNEKTPDSKYFVSHREFGKFNLGAYFRPFKTVYSCEAKRKIKKLIKDKKPELAHLHLIYHHLTPSILPVLKKNRIPVVATLHDWKYLCPNYLLFTQEKVCERCKGGKYSNCLRHRCIHNSVLQSALATMEAYFHHSRKYYEKYIDLYIAPSEFVKNKFVEFGYPAEKIVVLPHFLPDSFVKNLQKNTQPAMPLVFSYIGRLSPEKGIRRLCEIWLEQNIPYRLEVFGTGPQEKEIMALANKSDGRIIKRGFIPRGKIFEDYGKFCATIVPSACYETFGLSVLESLFAGVPCIVNDLGGLSEFTRKTAAVIGFSLHKPETLLPALQKVLEPKFREEAVRFAADYPTVEDYYQKLLSIYRDLL